MLELSAPLLVWLPVSINCVLCPETGSPGEREISTINAATANARNETVLEMRTDNNPNQTIKKARCPKVWLISNQ